ncbi:MAG: TolC family protein [Nannocystaceae bacterium]
MSAALLGALLSLAAAPPPSFGALQVEAAEVQARAAIAPLSLREVVGGVLDRHPRMFAANAEIEAAEGMAMAARGHFDTKWKTGGYLQPIGYYVHGRFDTHVEQATPLWGARFLAGYRLGQGHFQDYYGYYETLSAGEIRAGVLVPLWRDGPIDSGRAGIKKADIDRELALLDRDKETIKLVKETSYHYWEWVAAGLRRDVAEEQLDLAAARDAQLQSQAARGAIPPMDATDNKRALFKREASAVKYRQELAQASIALSLFFRDGDGEPIRPTSERLPHAIPLDARALSDEADALLREALERRPELQAILLKRAQVAIDRRLAQNQRAPAIDVGAMVLRDFGRGPAELAPTEVQTSVTIEIPLQARKARGKRKAAEAKVTALDAHARLLRDTIAAEVEQALVAVLATHDRAEVARNAVAVARELADAERRRFDLGATTLLFVNIREQQVAEAALDEIDARLAYQKALAELAATTAATLRELEQASAPAQPAQNRP